MPTKFLYMCLENPVEKANGSWGLSIDYCGIEYVHAFYFHIIRQDESYSGSPMDLVIVSCFILTFEREQSKIHFVIESIVIYITVTIQVRYLILKYIESRSQISI